MIIREFKNGNINIKRNYAECRASSLDNFINRVAEAIKKDLGYNVEVNKATSWSCSTLTVEGFDWVVTYDDVDTFNFYNTVKCTALNLNTLI